jgi:predicted nucleic acid-binding protein
VLFEEPGTELARGWLAEDPHILTYVWTRVELTGAIERRVREGRIARSQRRRILDRVEALAAAWDEVTDVLAVRAAAISLLARHALRAADAAQLGAALVAAEGNPATLALVCLDRALALAGEREGFNLLSWPVP